MIDVIRFILKNQIKQTKLGKKTGGFTLIELLVAMIVASLVIAPLLGFMIDILGTDRKEQAKSSTEQEIQSALNYITHDLEQSVYMYDGKGIDDIEDQLPFQDKTKTRVPVLVFWKREYLPQVISKNFNSFSPDQVNNIKCSTPGQGTNCNDAFVYSLVAYYLIKDEDKTWSNAARIARFELKDGVRNPNKPVADDGSPNYLDFTGKPEYNKDAGFKLFDLQDSSKGSAIEDRMNNWKNGGTITNDAVVLIDYIDQTQPKDNPQLPLLSKVDCQKTLGVKDEDIASKLPGRTKDDLRTPKDTVNKLNATSFYACVDTKTNTAKVYLRGNALARIQNSATYQKDSIYFPEASITVKGRGFLFNE